MTVGEHRAHPERVPLYWLNRSLDLRGAAAAVWYVMENGDDHDFVRALGLGEGFNTRVATFPSYLMLCGMSLESLIKAVVVSRGESAPRGHELHRLAKDAGLDLGDYDEGLLKLLSHYIAWYARYPAPRRNTFEVTSSIGRLTQRYFFDTEELPGGLIIRRPKRPGPLGWDNFMDLWGRVCKDFRMPDY